MFEAIGNLGTVAKIGAVLLGGIVIFVLVSRFLTNKQHYTSSVINTSNALIKKASQSSVLAHNDISPVFALMHVTEGLSNAMVARELMRSQDLNMLTGINIHNLVSMLEQQRDDVIQTLNRACPAVKVDGVQPHQSQWT
jgi:hypothetical protein